MSLSSSHQGPKPEIYKPVRIRNERIRFYKYVYHYYYWYHQIYNSIIVVVVVVVVPWEFSTSILNYFQRILSDSKSSLVFGTLLSILAGLNNVVGVMVPTCPPTYEFTSPFNNTSVTVSKAPITIDIIVTFMFHSFLISLVRSRCSFNFPSALFCGQSGQQSP